jgi:hypothetical protein
MRKRHTSHVGAPVKGGLKKARRNLIEEKKKKKQTGNSHEKSSFPGPSLSDEDIVEPKTGILNLKKKKTNPQRFVPPFPEAAFAASVVNSSNLELDLDPVIIPQTSLEVPVKSNSFSAPKRSGKKGKIFIDKVKILLLNPDLVEHFRIRCNVLLRK